MAIYKVTVECTCGGSTSWFSVDITSTAQWVFGEQLNLDSTTPSTIGTATTAISSNSLFFQAAELPTKIKLSLAVDTDESALDLAIGSGDEGNLTINSDIDHKTSNLSPGERLSIRLK